jgi:hypothetical protein
MKLCLIVGAVAAALSAVACGGNGSLVGGGCDPDDAYCPSSPPGGGSSGSGSGTSRDAGAAQHDGGSTEAGSEAGAFGSDAGSSGSGSGSSGSGGDNSGAGAQPGLCIPGNACGGLWECTDDCYADKCCVLDCSCTDPTGQSGTLQCSLTCP